MSIGSPQARATGCPLSGIAATEPAARSRAGRPAGGTHKVLAPSTALNHHPNPVDPETPRLCAGEIAGADLGIGLTGRDGIGIVDSSGGQVPGDLLTAFLAQDVAARHPAPRSFLMCHRAALQHRGRRQRPIWKTGHSHMKKRMRAQAPLAGEMSGHIFIADQYLGFDDAIYAAARVVTQMVTGGQSIASFMESLPEQHATPELRIDCPDEVKFGAMEKISAHVLSSHDPADVNTIDGVRVRSGGGWWLIRASNTEAALVAGRRRRREALDVFLGYRGNPQRPG